MIRNVLLGAALLAIVGTAVFWALTVPQVVPAAVLGEHTSDLVNGRSIFEVGGCSACHRVPNQPDRHLLGGGLALTSPFGTFYVPNISPEPRDGIGSWSDAQFVSALIKGTSPGGQHLYPAFPFTSYQHMRLDDARDLFAYVKTLPPVVGKVRAHELRFPFSMRRGIGLWKLLFLDGEPFMPNPAMSASWNRGAYLVNGLAHCAECHSPRNVVGAIVSKERFAGGPTPDGRGFVPNITQLALKDWSENDIAYLLQTGRAPDGDAVVSPMREVVENTAELGAEDRSAIATFIKWLPPIAGPQPPAKSSAK